MLKNLKEEKGSYLLEFAVAIPVFLTLVLAAFDISRVLQAYTATRESVLSTLRCVSSTDGGCRTVTLAEATPLYNWEISPSVVTVPYGDFAGDGSWLSAPNYTQSAQATILDTVSYSQAGLLYALQGTTYSASASISALERVFPRVNNDPADADVSGGTPQTVPLASQELWIAQSAGASATDTFSLRFTVPSLNVGSLPQGCLITSPAGTALSECSAGWPWRNGASFGAPGSPTSWRFRTPENGSELTDDTYVVLQIQGESRGTDSGSDGFVELSLSSRGSTLYELGGRLFGGASPKVNFYPRGAHPDWIHDGDKTNLLPDEYKQYQAIRLTRGETYTLNFRMGRQSGSTGDLRWAPTLVRVWYPKYTPVTKSFSCGGTKSSACDSSCNLSKYGYTGATVVADSQLVTSAPTSCRTSPPGGAELNALLSSEGSLCNPKLVTTSTCITEAGTIKCADNRGAPNNATPEQLAAICPPPAGSTLSNTTWSFRNIALDDLAIPFSGCSSVSPQVPPSWKSYASVQISPLRETGRVTIATGDTEPALFKVSSGRDLQCEQVRVETRSLDNCRDAQGTATLFSGTHLLNTLSWEGMLREEAYKCGVPKGTYLNLTGNIVWTVAPQGITSSLARYGASEIGWTTIDGGPYPAAYTPPQCEAAGATCRRNFSFVSTGSSAEQTEAITEKASDVMNNQLRVLYPAASTACDANSPAAYCVASKIERAGDGYRASAGIQVPLFLTKVLGKESVMIGYNSELTLEEKYLE